MSNDDELWMSMNGVYASLIVMYGWNKIRMPWSTGWSIICHFFDHWTLSFDKSFVLCLLWLLYDLYIFVLLQTGSHDGFWFIMHGTNQDTLNNDIQQKNVVRLYRCVPILAFIRFAYSFATYVNIYDAVWNPFNCCNKEKQK